ncbi:MAG: DUF3054 domain-containing protein [Corynebacterium sp.]|nr:DUF3054 domain-containing protein [Corynebacterium sp.]
MNVSKAALADVASMMAFALLARIAHNSEELPLNFVGWLDTLWPFLTGLLLGWLITLAAKWNQVKVAPAGVTIWILAAAVGLGIWGARHGAVPHWSFILVASSMSALLLLGWRGIAAAVGKRK